MTYIESSAPSPAESTASRGTEPSSTPTDRAKPRVYRIELVILPAEPEPIEETFEGLLIALVKSMGHSTALAIAFVNRLASHHLHNTEVLKLAQAVELLPEETDQVLVIELVAKGAFTRRELREPERIIAYLARPDWRGIFSAWRKSPLPTIGQVIEGMKAAQHREAKKNAPPPPAGIDNGRDNRDVLANHLKARLPRRFRDCATDLAETIRVLADNPTVDMDTEVLATKVRHRRAGTGSKVCLRTIRAGLPHLAELGYVFIEGDKARICSSALV